MTDNICHSILKTATQQIIQSAGFEAANNQSIETLTDVFGKYIELLGSTVSAYANLNGRTLANERDLLSALGDLSLDTCTMKEWVEEDGKALTPCWSAQSDPSRLLQDVVNGGKACFDDIIEYKFGYVEEYELPSSPLEELSPIMTTDSLPDYIPSYFPPFPEIKEDVTMDEADAILLEKQQKLEEQRQKQLQMKEKAESLPLPVIVKKRKKPIDNPFTHIIPFEDSSLASENEEAQQKALSLSLKVEQNGEKKDEETEIERRNSAAVPLVNALQKVKPPTYTIGEGLKDKDRLFIQQAQDAAAPGSHLFNQDAGIFDKLVRHIADPLAISKLTAPNLLIDVATITSATVANNSPSVTPHHMLFDYNSPGSSLPTSPEGPVKISRSSSMLAVLAGGTSKKGKLVKKLNGSNPPVGVFPKEIISKSSIDINSFKTGDSKYIIKKKRMLAEQEAAAKRQKLLEQQRDNPTEETNNEVTTTPTITTPITTAPFSVTPTAMTMQNKPLVTSTITPTTTTPKISVQANNVQKPKGPISLQSFSTSSLTTPLSEKKKKNKKTLNLMLNTTQNSVLPIDENNTPSTPKIRFKVKAPESSTSEHQPIKVEKPTNYQLHLYQQPAPVVPQRKQHDYGNSFTSSEEIRCICENPTVDYGNFMIACDSCGVWFHGSCVGIKESDQVEEWYCKRCKRKN